MAWKPPTQKAFDAGEIPGKKEITAAQQANLDKYRPEKDVDAMFGGITMAPLDLPDVDLTAFDTDIVDFLDELKDQKKFGLGVTVLDKDFEILMEAEISSSGKALELEKVLAVAYSCELQNPMFYFGIGFVNNEMKVVITSIPSWEENKSWDVKGLSGYVAPDFLCREKENVYGFGDDMTASKARKELIKLGFVEQHEIVE